MGTKTRRYGLRQIEPGSSAMREHELHEGILHCLDRIAGAVEESVHNSVFQCQVFDALRILQQQGERIIMLLDRLTEKVEKVRTVQASAIALLAGLSEQIKACGVDQAKLTVLTDQLDANASELADAVVANTPAEPA